MHNLRTRWMLNLLLLIVPDQCDDQDAHSPSAELYAFKDVSFQQLEEDARNLAQKLNYFTKHITR